MDGIRAMQEQLPRTRKLCGRFEATKKGKTSPASGLLQLIVPGEADDLPSLPFVGAPLTLCFGLVLQFALRGSGFAAGFALRVFGELLLRQRGGNTPVTQVAHRNDIFFITPADAQTIPLFKAAAGFDPVTVDLDFTAFDSFTGECAGLEEPRGP